MYVTTHKKYNLVNRWGAIQKGNNIYKSTLSKNNMLTLYDKVNCVLGY